MRAVLRPPGFWLQVVYKRYASLYFVAGVEAEDNELIALEVRRWKLCSMYTCPHTAVSPPSPKVPTSSDLT